MTVFVVRHAVAVSRRDWDGHDRERPLTKRGQRQAQGLVTALDGEDIDRVLTSPATRCIQTVAPLVDGRGVPVEHAEALMEGADPSGALSLVHEAADNGSGVVLCTHGDLIPDVLRALKAAGVGFDGWHQWEKGSTWILRTRHGRVTQARYLPPPA